jgi:phosphoglycolate phosphatase
MKGAAVLFDLDGTLVDSVPDLARALGALLAELGEAPLAPQEVAPMVGDGAGPLVERALAARGLEPDASGARLARFLALYEAAPAALTRPYEGVPETLGALRREGWRLGLVTNKPERATRLLLEALGLAGFFEAVVGGDTTPWKKPDPRPLAAALGAMGAASAVFVGDNENDAAAAHAAGLPLVLVRHGYSRLPVETLGAAALLDRFDALPVALRRLLMASRLHVLPA